MAHVHLVSRITESLANLIVAGCREQHSAWIRKDTAAVGDCAGVVVHADVLNVSETLGDTCSSIHQLACAP